MLRLPCPSRVQWLRFACAMLVFDTCDAAVPAGVASGLRRSEPHRPKPLSDTENLPLFSLKLIFGEQALVFHGREFLNLDKLIVQAARLRSRGSLLRGGLLLRQGLLLSSEFCLLRLQICHLLLLCSGLLLRSSFLLP